jgi:formylglycine-generating enzyme required for sulfatase activity
LSHIILHLLQKDPEKRYQSADKLLEHLKTLGGAEAPPSLRPKASHDIEGLRSVSTPAPTPSSRMAGTTRSTSGAHARAQTPLEPAPAPSVAAQPQAPPRRKLLPLFAGLAGVLAVALGITVYFAMGREQPAPPPQPPPVEPLPELVHTTTGDMLLISAGEFLFGAANDVVLPIERPEGFQAPNARQAVVLRDFYVDVTEVSNGTYKQFCDATGRAYPQPPPDDAAYFESKPDYPVVNVTFEDAQAFAQWAGKRLPTEQEWEKAARGIDGRIYPWGNTISDRQANAAGNADGFDGAAPVNSLPAGSSPYGILNMSGNVWEWTASVYEPSPQETADQARAWKEVGVIWKPGAPWFVIKGGSYITPPDDLDLLAFFRAAMPSDIKTAYQGFRCAMDAPQSAPANPQDAPANPQN